jgi:Flp pilus assembly protein TadD
MQLFAGRWQSIPDAWREAEQLLTDALSEVTCGRYAEALEILNRAIALRCDDPNLWLLRGLSHLESGHYGFGIIDLMEAIRLDVRCAAFIPNLHSSSRCAGTERSRAQDHQPE